jgi:signal transduction histidine kinase
MNTLIQLSTSYIILGTLFLVMPVATWAALSPNRTAAVRVWCVAGALFGVAILLIGMRQALPAWVSYPLANTMVWFSCMMMLKALCMELNFCQPRWKLMAISALVMCLVFEYLRTGIGHSLWRFNWAMGILLGLTISIAGLAFKLYSLEKRKSALLIASSYALASCGILIRITRSLLGYANPDIMTSVADGLVISVTIFPVAILGNMGFIGLYMERMKERDIAQALEKERQESRMRLSAQIAHMDRQRSMAEMSAALVHEIGQPLTAAQVDCHVAEIELSRVGDAPPRLIEALRDLRGSIQRSNQILSRIRDFIKGNEPVLWRVRWEEIYRDVIDLIPHKERPAGLEVRWHSVQQNLWIRADRIQLSQVLLNLLRNAFQAANPHTPLLIQLREEQVGDEVVLFIQDNGTGMAPQTLLQAGRAFFTTKPDGLGVGLSIARSIVEQHGGRLQIESATGEGTQIQIRLPAELS